MIVLGVNPGRHDGSAALVVDGRLVAVVETERLTRQKRAWAQPPARAIARCLAHQGLELADVDVVALGWDLPRAIRARGGTYSPDALAWWLQDDLATEESLLGRVRPPRTDTSVLAKVRFVPHHLAHAASGYLCGPASEALVVVLDGTGETEGLSVFAGSAGTLRLLESWSNDLSWGRYYGNATEWAGFDYWEAGKLMGLASYGTPRSAVPLRSTGDGFVLEGVVADPASAGTRRDPTHASTTAYFDAHCYPYGRGDGSEPMAYANFAASVQESLNAAALDLCRRYADQLGLRSLVLTGGVASNCTTNGHLRHSGFFDEVFVPPFPYDAGTAVGAALLVDRDLQGGPGPVLLRDAALGVGSDPAVTQRARAAHPSLRFTQLDTDQVPRRAAELILAGQIVCWFEGRPEVGQRALGRRSILADPRRRSILTRVNHLKGREVWRPLAPSVHRDDWDTLFDSPAAPLHSFMLSAERMRQEWRRRLPAVVHVDESCRPQHVDPDVLPRFAALLDQLRPEIGVGAVLNTSFNLAGEPIVSSVDDALSTFARSQFDALVLDTMLVEHR